MENKDKSFPELENQNNDRDRKLKDELGAEVGAGDLTYNEEDNSYEWDVKSEDPEYVHPDPYDTSVPNGGDFDSDYDEANPTAVTEYDKDASLETDLSNLGMHISDGAIVELNAIDEELAQTPEDDRDDLDEEGYPINDTPLK
ncbi:MAG TPA: hypothetical protein VNI52_14565 [Sphingobacteriaceae bacterium]|nr:hypothetical protein [Sphingobacteriaceae bacterium]